MEAGVLDPDLPHRVLSAALSVHERLGPGLARTAYEECLCIELDELGVAFERGTDLRFAYRGRRVDAAARLDVVVEERLLVLVAAQDAVGTVDVARLESLLRLGGFRDGLLVNFNVTTLRKGVHRVKMKRRGEADPRAV